MICGSPALLKCKTGKILAVVCRIAWVDSSEELVEQLRGVVWPEQKVSSNRTWNWKNCGVRYSL